MKTFVLLLLLLVSLGALAQDKTAYDIWNDMTEAAINYTDERTIVQGAEEIDKVDDAGKKIKNAGQMVMYGGEKEGSSALITRIMGPNKGGFKSWVNNLPGDKKKEFLKTFLTDFSSGKIRMKKVIDKDGNLINFDLDGLKGVNFHSLSDAELDAKFDLYLERGGDKHFSHLKKQTRMNIFNGKYGGLSRDLGMKKNINYGVYKPLYGAAEKYIDAAHGTSVGWEINFNPQRSYGEFEHMIGWFRDELKNVGERFQAPGHQWIVYPKSKEVKESAEVAADMIDKLGEVQKNSQAYIVLKGIEGNAGIELSNYKSVHSDASLIGRHSVGRGVIRLENNRFKIDGQDAFAIEYRAGVKSDKNRRLTQKFLVSRYAANEFDDLASGQSWTLNSKSQFDKKDLMKRFGVTDLEADKFLKAIDGVGLEKHTSWGSSTKKISHAYLVPLWEWENAPYLSAGKKQELKNLSRTYIKSVASMDKPDLSSVRLAMKDWAKTSRLSHDIENYLKPKQKLADLDKAHIFETKWGADVDVNKIDMGIEYSARFPLKTSADFVEVPGQKKKFEWQKTYFDYNEAERKAVIRNFAKRLGKELNDGVDVPVVELKSDGHGHGLDIAFEVKDKEGRKWRAEWDGIGRNYDVDSKMITESVRGGHVEIVTPKFQPNAEDTKKLFRAMEKENLIPQSRFGGGHINIDLAPFEGKPKKMARFLGSYLDNRNVMSMMFQHPGRQIGAEPFKVSQEVINKLKNFNGSEEELKKLLYNEKFFNTRVGRKTKNSQLNLTAYFQDVIPEKFIHEDFDMKNDTWRRTFDVEPKIRKMEFRMFNAPRNQAESALQIKFTKALLNKALNEDDAVFKTAGKVNYEELYRNPDLAFKEFQKTMDNLGLDAKEYKGLFLEGLENTKNMVDSPNYVSIAERLQMHPEISDWDEAVAAREVPIASEGRHWAGDDVLPEAKVYAGQQMIAREAAEANKQYLNPKGRLNRDLEKLPLEVTLSLDEIEKLDDRNKLVALYYQKSKTKVKGPYQDLLKKVKKSDDYVRNVMTYIGNAEDLSLSPGFLDFLSDNLPSTYKKGQHEYLTDTYRYMLNSPDDRLRAKARKYLTSHPDSADILLKYASEISDRKVIKEILSDLDGVKISAKNPDYAQYIVGILDNVDDPESVRHIFNISSSMDNIDKRDIYLKLLDHKDPKVDKIANSLIRKHYPEDFFFHAREGLYNPDTPADKKAIFGKFVNESKVFDNMKPSEIFALPERQQIIAANELYHSKGANSGTKAAITKELKKDIYFERFQDVLKQESRDPELSRWIFDKFKENDKFKNLDPTNSEDLRILSSTVEDLTKSPDANLRKEALAIVDKFDHPELNKTYTTTVLTDANVPDDLKAKMYDDLLKDPKKLKALSKYEPSTLESIISNAERSVASGKEYRTSSAKLISNLSASGNDVATNSILNLARAEDPSARSISYVLQGNKNFEEINRALPRTLGNKNLSSVQKKIIKNGVEKHKDFIKNLSKADLDKMSLDNKVYYAYKNSDLVGNFKILDELDKTEDTGRAFLKVLNEGFDGKIDPDYQKWLVNAMSSKEMSYLDPQFKTMAIAQGLSSDNPKVWNAAIDNLKVKGKISAKDLNTHSNLLLDHGVNEEKLKAFLNSVDKKSLKDTPLRSSSVDNLVRVLGNTSNTNTKTVVASFVKELPDKQVASSVLNNLSEVKDNRQASIILKSNKSSDGFKALTEMQKSKDPVVKKNANLGLKNNIANAKSVKKIDTLDVKEQLNIIYRKNTGSNKVDDITRFLKQIPADGSFVSEAQKIIESNQTPANYKKWVIGLLEDKDNIKALGLKKVDVNNIMDIAMSSDKVAQEAGLKLIRNDNLVSSKNKIGSIAKMSSQTEDSIDTLKLLAKNAPSDPRLTQVVKSVLVDQSLWNQSKLSKKSSELMMMLSRGSVEDIVRHSDEYFGYYSNNAKGPKFVLLGAAKHDSAVVADFAKKHINSDDPAMKKLAVRISDNWDKKSALGKIANRTGCVGRSVRNVLNRLTFR